MDNLVVVPVLLPLVAGLLALLGGRPSRGRRAAAALAQVAQVVVAMLLLVRTLGGETPALSLGGWPVPFGIVLVVDPLAALMLVLSTVTGLACLLHGFADQRTVEEHPLRLPLFSLLSTGIHLAFVTGDLFNLFVAFEVMLLASYGLLTLEARHRETWRAFPYLTMNLVGSALFLAGCGLAYGAWGTLNFAELVVRLDPSGADPRVAILGGLFLVVFGLKAGLFPIYSWLPGSYPILPTPVAAFYSGLLTKVGVYVLLRFCGTVLPPETPVLQEALAWVAGATMVFGVLGAVSRGKIVEILAYHIVSQIGFMVLAIGLGGQAGYAAAILYVAHHIIVKGTLFLVGGMARTWCGSDDLGRTAGLARVAPVLAAVFLLQAMSLAGLPPFSGFWGKYLIVVEGLAQGRHILVAASIVASVLTLVSMLKIWLGAFWREDEAVRVEPARGARAQVAVVAALTAVSVAVGLGIEGVARVAGEAARRTLDRAGYAEAVFRLNEPGVRMENRWPAEPAGGDER